MTHLSPQLIRTFNSLFNNFDHHFIIYLHKGDSAEKYQDLLDNKKFNISIINKTSELKHLINKKDSVLLHSLMPEVSLYLISHFYSKVSVVCWGSGIKLVNLKNYILYPVKLLIYHSYRYMITLMEPDKNYLKKVYFIKNILNQPYIGEREKVLSEYLKEREFAANDRTAPNNLIYIGNNSSCKESYLFLAKNYLSRIGDELNVQFMLHYDYDPNDSIYSEIENICKDRFKSFSFNTNFYNLYEYARYIDKCQVYICGESRQTGLGAIYTAIRLGKKIYLNGNNYDWIISLGCKIHHINELRHVTINQLLEPENMDIIINNSKIIDRLESFENKIKGWNRALSDL